MSSGFSEHIAFTVTSILYDKSQHVLHQLNALM